MGTIKVKVHTVIFVLWIMSTCLLTGCLYTPGFRGVKVIAPGDYEIGGNVWWPVLNLAPGCGGMLIRGMGENWDLGMEGAFIVGDFTGPEYFVSLACRTRSQLSPSSMFCGKLGYFGQCLPFRGESFYIGDIHYLFGEISGTWVKELGKGEIYWGIGAGFCYSLYPLGVTPAELCPGIFGYPQLFLGYKRKSIILELECNPWPKLCVGIGKVLKR